MINKRYFLFLMLLPLFLFCSCNNKNDSVESIISEEDYSAAIYETKAEKASKNETVYINLSSSGAVEKINVSEWIYTDKNGVYVDDVSILDNIKNIKSNIMPEQSGNNLRWNMPENDLYYTGTTDRALPVSFDIEYYLDGVLIPPEELAGKSGEVIIKININNNTEKKVKIGDKEYTVKLPVIAVGGMILHEKFFSDVECENAQIFSDGSKHLLAFATVPGMSESLGIKPKKTDDLISAFTENEITVKTNAEGFLIDNMYFAVIPVASLISGPALPETVNEVGDIISLLIGMRDVFEKTDPDKLIYSLISDEEKVRSIIDAVNKASELYEENKNLIELAGKYSTPENSEKLRNILEFLNEPDVKAMLSVISDPEVQSFITGLPIILENFGDLAPLVEEIQKDLQRSEVQKELSALPETVEKLSDIMNTISQNEKEIDALMSALEGDSLKTIEALIQNIDTDSLESFENKYGDIIQDSDLFSALTEAWLLFGEEYGLYGGNSKDMNVSMMFIYKTSSVKYSIS